MNSLNSIKNNSNANTHSNNNSNINKSVTSFSNNNINNKHKNHNQNHNNHINNKKERKGSDSIISMLSSNHLSSFPKNTKQLNANTNTNTNFNTNLNLKEDDYQNISKKENSNSGTLQLNSESKSEKNKTEKILQNLLNLLGRIHQENILIKKIMFKTKNQMRTHKHYKYMEELTRFINKNILENLHFHKPHLSKIIK